MTKTNAAEIAEQTQAAPEKKVLTRAEKSRRQKDILRSLLNEKDYKWNDLLEEATQRYAAMHSDEEYDVADLKGKLGSSFSLMEEGGEVTFDKKTNLCALVKKEEKAEPKKRGRKKAVEKAEEAPAVQVQEPEKKTVKKTTKKAVKSETEQPEPPKAEPKKRGRKKAEAKVEAEQTPQAAEAQPQAKQTQQAEIKEKASEIKEEKPAPAVIDITDFFSDKKPKETPAKDEAASEQKTEQKPVEKKEEKAEKKPVLTEFAFLGNAGVKAKADAQEKERAKEKTPETEESKKETKKQQRSQGQAKTPEKQNKPQERSVKTAARGVRGKASAEPTEEEKLKAEFLKKLRSLGGTYFEYYSVYLLERYSLKNGRRLEGLKISGGDTDGGIDGEIELTDKFGFREVIYIQAKNWDPSKGDKDKWVVGETLLQQFVGAVTYRQAKEGKRKCRGIFVTTSRFTEGAKEILESLSADFIGYDGDDVYEAAKECSFGLYEKDGKWQIDEKLLSGEKAFFNMI